jgi:hypothetical protein
VHAENYGHAKTLLQAFACGLRGKNTARAPCLCLAIWPIFARRQHVEARTAGCKRALKFTKQDDDNICDLKKSKIVKIKMIIKNKFASALIPRCNVKKIPV